MSDYNVILEYDHDSDETFAKNVAQVLTGAYPGHPWHINITGGLIVLKHMRMSAKWAMNLHYKAVNGDFQTLKRGLLTAGGELLERAGLARGKSTEAPITKIDGIPDKDRIH